MIKYLRTAIWGLGNVIRWHGLPVQAMRVENVQSKVGGTLDGDALGLGGLVAEANRDAIVVPLGTDLVGLAAMTARALFHFIRDSGLDHLGQKGHVNRWTRPRTLDHTHVVTVSGLKIRDNSI